MERLRLFRAPSSMTTVFIMLGALILLFIFLPLFKMLFASSPGTLWHTLLEDEVYSSILLTIYAAALATVVGLVLGVPLAYLLARHDFRGKGIIEGLIDVPIVVPHSAAGIALLFIFGHQFFLGKLFGVVGLDFVDALPGIVIAMMFVSIPFLIDSAKEGFAAVDPKMEKVARTLGASPWQSFLRISLPLARRSIFAGSVMMWARGVSEFGAVLILAYHPMVAPVLVWTRFESQGLDAALPVAVLLIIVSLVVFISLRAVVYRRKKTS